MADVGYYDIAIVGGGASGSAVLLALSQGVDTARTTIMFDPNRPGPGTPYRTDQPGCLLMNGPARAMSVVPGDDSHLLRWLQRADGDELIPRKAYGAYLQATVERTFALHPNFCYRQRDVVDIEAKHGTYVLTDRSNNSYRAKSVVLALGNFAPDDSFLPKAVRSYAGYRGDPWRIRPSDVRGSVAIIGSGLTALDIAAQLDECGFEGTIHAVSRHGRFPALEDPSVRGRDPASLPLDVRTPLSLLRSTRAAIREETERGGDWRGVLEAVRGIAPDVWGCWTHRERRSFLRHLQSIWTAQRYRVPPATYDAFRRLAVRKQIHVIAGQLTGAHSRGEKTLRMSISQADRTIQLDAQVVINATGPNLDYTRIRHPLVRNALRRGLIRSDCLRLGLDVTPALQCIGEDGSIGTGLFTLGPAVRGRYYETTALPEIRAHALSIARTICRQTLRPKLEAAS
ncbi:MAG: FAD/NAD(P)-binding protein [Candidatus Eremiobacteraeota bacterium]|nr:FAD/NAD(P)-binding protein [Candidatus Eremiobacteraeota bacterium]